MSYLLSDLSFYQMLIDWIVIFRRGCEYLCYDALLYVSRNTHLADYSTCLECQ